jgi:hypothetical protein
VVVVGFEGNKSANTKEGEGGITAAVRWRNTRDFVLVVFIIDAKEDHFVGLIGWTQGNGRR